MRRSASDTLLLLESIKAFQVLHANPQNPEVPLGLVSTFYSALVFLLVTWPCRLKPSFGVPLMLVELGFNIGFALYYFSCCIITFTVIILFYFSIGDEMLLLF